MNKLIISSKSSTMGKELNTEPRLRRFTVTVNQEITEEAWLTFHTVHVYRNSIHPDIGLGDIQPFP